ncbi:hypothetical protein SAMN05421869_1278 [Nonomuraea jiangxiensis]|uniref:Uncharacterized protein n=1 Tax=Nonomuraea jiangxiensis TaxID=633440 RepID=A0A1G9KV90_9ACTN|nr:hypothetical protein SAMN05421869_1278 [Nonomuraea jiangxiensis]
MSSAELQDRDQGTRSGGRAHVMCGPFFVPDAGDIGEPQGGQRIVNERSVVDREKPLGHSADDGAQPRPPGHRAAGRL